MDLDNAFLRRFTKRIYVPLPKEDERIQLLENFVGEYKHCLSASDVYLLAGRTAR